MHTVGGRKLSDDIDRVCVCVCVVLHVLQVCVDVCQRVRPHESAVLVLGHPARAVLRALGAVVFELVFVLPRGWGNG